MKSAGLLIAVSLIGCQGRETAPAESPRHTADAATAAAESGTTAPADDDALRDARVVPEFRDGAVIGFRFEGVRPDTVIAKLGLQEHDVLTAYNGQALTSPDAALNFYAALKNHGSLTLDIIRDGKPMKLEVTQ